MADAPLVAVGTLGEMALVRRVLELLGTGETGTGPVIAVRVGPGDDAAVVSWPGDVVLSTDSQQEGVHFRREWIEPEALGSRAIAVNASDLGAMGGEPRGFLVALTLPPDTALAWVEQLALGLRAGAERFGAIVLGGDVARGADRVAITVTAVGELEPGLEPICRSGAVSSDRCWVSGHPGRAAAGRSLLEAGFRLGAGGLELPVGSAPDLAAEAVEAAEQCIRAFVDPDPPTRFGHAAARAGLVAAMIDISDGLGVDLRRVCDASGIGAELDAGALFSDPVLETVAAVVAGSAEEWVLRGGEDYQLLCAVASEHEAEFSRLAGSESVAARAVGRFSEPVDGLQLRRGDARHELDAPGWDHFS